MVRAAYFGEACGVSWYLSCCYSVALTGTDQIISKTLFGTWAECSPPLPKKHKSGFFFQGDALMRLPSVSYDKNELVHGISGDGSESVMEAEEYLCPVEHQRQQRPNSALWSYDRQLSPNFAVSGSR